MNNSVGRDRKYTVVHRRLPVRTVPLQHKLHRCSSSDMRSKYVSGKIDEGFYGDDGDETVPSGEVATSVSPSLFISMPPPSV